jgi:hypothetical protein
MNEHDSPQNRLNESRQTKGAKACESDLNPLEEQILSHLATTGPMDIDETAKGISAPYDQVYAAFDSLEKKELINPVGKVSYRGRDYDTFWLAEKGLLEILLKGEDSKLVLEVVKKTFPKYDDMSLFAQIACRLPERALRLVSSLYPSVSLQVGIEEVLNLVFIHSDLSVDQLKTLYDIVRGSPRHKQIADKTIKKASNRFEELKKIIGIKYE